MIYVKSKQRKIYWIIFVILWPLVFSISLLAIIGNLDKNNNSNLIPNINVQKYLSLSNNNPNVIFLYFDRTQGILWNSLLKIDEIINKQNSFTSMFPEITSYINTLSLGTLTKLVLQVYILQQYLILFLKMILVLMLFVKN